MNKIIVPIVVVLVLLPFLRAEWIQPLDCQKLLDESTVMPSTDYQALANICFYGSGYSDDKVTVSLKSENNTYNEDVTVTHGVISSASSQKSFFSNVAAGVYRLIAKITGKNVEYSEDIVVRGPSDGGDNGGGEPHDVPEFSIFAAGLALAGAAIFINSRRMQR